MKKKLKDFKTLDVLNKKQLETIKGGDTWTREFLLFPKQGG